mmetsp:Transcript_41909/g.67233  ORF Transcript_41909/g.67233 Transcript_41909/m.67233 type:complete len:391 (+) Transcript_41909:389-1561(+)
MICFVVTKSNKKRNLRKQNPNHFVEKTMAGEKATQGGSWIHVIVLTTIAAITLANWALTEIPRAKLNVARSGFSGLNAYSGVVLVWCLTMIIEQVFLFSKSAWAKRYRGLKEEHKRKVIVYLLELIWGTMCLGLLVGYILRIYVLKYPEGCSSEIVSMKTYIDQTYCTRVETLPSTDAAMGLPFVNPGTDVTTLTKEQSEQFALLANSCLVQNGYGLYASCTFGVAMYAFELIFLGRLMRKSLIVHHFSSFVLLVLLTEVPLSSGVALACLPPLVGAVLEQPTFFALAVYRLFPSSSIHWYTFYAAWVSFGVTKMVALIMGFYFLFKYWSQFTFTFQLIYTFSCLVSLFSQIYSTYAQYMVWKKCGSGSKRELKSRVESEMVDIPTKKIC